MQTQELSYHDGNVELKAIVANIESSTPKPGVLVCHAWAGRDDFSQTQAKKLAEMGYVGFALDMYGDAKIGTDNDECTQLMTPFMQDRELLLKRMNLALAAMKKLDSVDQTKTAVIGFCFGGLCALDLARGGADLRGAVSFHGLLQGTGKPNASIKAKILSLHGYDDPMVTPETALAFANEMGPVDWQLHMYGSTKHAFTNPQANDHEFGTVFSKTANQRAFKSMENFLEEIFA